MYKAYGDPGNGYTKFIDNRDNEVLRQTVFSALPDDIDKSKLGIETDFGNFLFDSKIQDISAIGRQFRDYRDCLSDAYAANVLLAISQMNGANIVNCELVLSLPFGALYLENELIEHLTGEHVIKRVGHHKQTINVSFPKDKNGKNKWGIVPQNAIPVFATFNLKDIKREKEIWFAVANLGSMTFEMGTFGLNLETFDLLPGLKAQQQTRRKGMYTLANEIRPLLIAEFRDQHTDFSQHQIFDILINEVVWVGNEPVSVSDIVRPKKEEYLEAIYNYCREVWTPQNGRGILEMYQLTSAGGGAHLLTPFLRQKKYHNNIVSSLDPQFGFNPQLDVVLGAEKWHELIGE